jgi:hypothetical protein
MDMPTGGGEPATKGESRMHDLSRRQAARLILLATVAPFATALPSVAAEPAPLAISGYDPVAYFTTGAPARGRPELEYEWDEQRYRFARPEHRAAFMADPVRFAPQFAGFCAMSLTRGEIVEANPESFLISDGKLYIFGKAVGPALFAKDLAGNIAKANENRSLVVKH